MLNTPGLLLFLVVVAIPAYYFNKCMIRLTRPKGSFGRLMIYFLLSVVVAMIYSALAIFIITRFNVFGKK